jgi:ATP-dependent DNA helicase RecQ
VAKACKQGPGLVYGGTRRNCEQLAETIKQQLGIPTEAYHAGIEQGRRKQVQQNWIDDKVPLVVATNAFGMGIDKADCRFVIHYEMPYSLEAYYQEAGRAGRDGKESFPILLYKSSDAIRAEKRIKDSYPEKEQLQKVYDALCDTLNLAVGSDMEKAEQVSLAALKKRAQMPRRIVRACLKVLHQLGVIQLIEHIAPQVGVQFIVGESYIRDKIDSYGNKQKSAFVDILYRQYGTDAFGEMKYLELDYLCKKLNISPNGVVKGLQVLQKHDHLLVYESIGELPLVRLIDNRCDTLPFTRQELERHRDSLLKKLEYMKGYIQTGGCREVYIRKYFGESDVDACGHCDNCLGIHRDTASGITDEEVKKVAHLLQEGSKSFEELQRLTHWNKKRIRQSLSFLIREERVESEAEKYRWREGTR